MWCTAVFTIVVGIFGRLRMNFFFCVFFSLRLIFRSLCQDSAQTRSNEKARSVPLRCQRLPYGLVAHLKLGL
ncbi:hypothetical protein HOY80DRAFT_971863 [Tuber brumale]|nr:hypothetical protein HOY80DRAFT_971863 [Tuber brumale]